MLGATLWAVAFRTNDKDVGLIDAAIPYRQIHYQCMLINGLWSFFGMCSQPEHYRDNELVETLWYHLLFARALSSCLTAAELQECECRDREAAKLTKLATGAAHCPDALAEALPFRNRCCIEFDTWYV